MKVYRTGYFAKDLIQEMEAEKWTDKTLTVNGNRHNWVSRWDRFHKSHDEAYDYIHSQAVKSVADASSQLDLMRNKLTEIQNYKDAKNS